MTRIESFLLKEIGLDATSIGSSLIERSVRLRMKALGLKTIEQYCDRVEKFREERMELVESVVVNETWFFRDPDAFAAFVRMVMQDWSRRQLARPLRVLSVPCSTGEEPYSLAIALLDAGLPPERFAVEALDISARSLARAKRAIFGKNSFRGQELSFRERYFRQGREGYALDPRVCGCVHFVEGNLLADSFLVGRTPYDFIFCRNLLIYFDRPTQTRALGQLKQMLLPEGVLFVGPAELPIFLDNGFVSLELPMAFACRKAIAGATTRRKRPESLRLAALAAPVVEAKPVVRNRPSAEPKPPAVPEARAVNLAEAQRLADAGQLESAADICEAWLREKGPSAQAYYLLGLIRDAAGAPQADDFYRKALYLEPGHYESLWHLALLLEKNGDAAGARAYKLRAERAQKKVTAKA